MTPLFSIVVPIYNIEKYLDKCIQSLLHQTYANIEIVLVDDGSPDNCPLICDGYATQDQRIKVVHKANGGLVSARQAGVAEATGEYIACVDGDDWISRVYFQKFAEIVSKHKPDVACCGSIWVYNNIEVPHLFPMKHGLYERADIEREIFPQLIESENGIYFPPSLWAKVFRRKIYQQQQLVDTFVNIGEDHACVKPCVYKAQSLYILEDCLYYYRQTGTSMTKSKKAFDWNGPRIIGQHFEKQIDMTQFDFQEQVYRSVVHNLFNICESQFNRNESYRVIAYDIEKHINEPYYKKAIDRCIYKGSWKGLLARFTLFFKLTPLIWIRNRLLRWRGFYDIQS
ncbi:glycosyltransferase family 2 protein [Cloacibacillus evryensis]|uniref:glycosyltransferase family 2 protein n=1 Tax=Cloacibacillus evryensis TaxID=508460 RepID=UPI0026DF3873|nr:glycosyltransferase family 2 protein [Cloacibacillus evryensis]